MSRFWSMGKGTRSNILSNKSPSPGPCAYNPKVKRHTPSWSMHGTKNRNIYRASQVPGPGAYNLPAKVRI